MHRRTSDRCGALLNSSRRRTQSKLQRYEQFLDLDDCDLERLIAAIARAEARDIQVLLLRCPEDIVQEHLADRLTSELYAIACGHAEFDTLAQLNHVPDDLREAPTPWISFLIETRIAEAEPLMRKVISAFIAENLAAVKFAILRRNRK